MKKDTEKTKNEVQWKLASPAGNLYLTATKDHLTGVFWRKSTLPLVTTLEDTSPSSRILKDTIHQLSEYFAGRRKHFELPLSAGGTDFQNSVWQQLARIPYGQTRSYSDIALKIKNHKAMRAVGTANSKNPYSIIVPCHRVIAAKGTMGGYAGGLPAKTFLLNLEQQHKD